MVMSRALAFMADPNLATSVLPGPDDGFDIPAFLDRTGTPVPVESLDLREWVGISGAAVSPGMGRNTGLGKAMLFTLANLRLGYWWNSGAGMTGPNG